MFARRTKDYARDAAYSRVRRECENIRLEERRECASRVQCETGPEEEACRATCPRWRFSNRRSARAETPGSSVDDPLSDSALISSVAGEDERERSGDANGEGEREAKLLRLEVEEDGDSDGREDDQLNPERVSGWGGVVSSKEGKTLVERRLRSGARSGEESSRWKWAGDAVSSSSTFASASAVKVLWRDGAPRSKLLNESAIHLRSSWVANPAASRCASAVNCAIDAIAGERFIGIERGPAGDTGVSGNGRTSKIGAGGNKGANGVASTLGPSNANASGSRISIARRVV